MTDFLTEIDRALDAGDTPAAAALARRALAAGSQDPLVANLVAWRHEEDGQYDQAEAVLATALARTPGEASLHLARGSLLRKQGQMKAAVECFESAIRYDPAYGSAWFERGATFEMGGAIADAADDYRHVLKLEPDNAAAHAALAAVSARRGERDLAERHARQAMRLDPANPIAGNALAQLALEDGRFEDAVALLEPGSRDADNPQSAIGRLTLLGDAYAGLGRHDDAYASYTRAQGVFQTVHSGRLTGGTGASTEFLQTIETSLLAADKTLWPGLADATGPGAARHGPAVHVILTGYPRSGTTLVENVLASLPDTVAIEERPTLTAVDQQYLGAPGGLGRLAALPEAELDILRDDYWARATRAADADLADRMFVDMDPFKGSRLPAIARLFPQAKVVIMRRDPRDVVWSCFHTNFAFNAATIAFSTLESTARHYDRTWRIIEMALAELPIDAFALRYDALVREFDQTTQALCRFLGVPWSEQMRRFDKTAQARGVSTASVTQVRRGLYDGSGGWRPYAAQMATVEPILRPWIERFEAG